jgi:hypothetical protein
VASARAFLQHALRKAPPPGILGMHVQDGGFHVKAAQLTLDRPYFAAKLNANFPYNGAAAVAVYRRAVEHEEGAHFSFNA